MKITKHLGTFDHYKEVEYTPTPEELLYYYSGTSGSLDPDNLYSEKKTKMSKIIFKPAKENK